MIDDGAGGCCCGNDELLIAVEAAVFVLDDIVEDDEELLPLSDAGRSIMRTHSKCCNETFFYHPRTPASLLLSNHLIPVVSSFIYEWNMKREKRIIENFHIAFLL